jgi:aspartate aminotransferase
MELSNRASNVSPSLTLQITAKAAKLKADGHDVISFGAGEPDFKTPQYIVDAAKEALDIGFTRYTAASGMPELKTTIAEFLKKKQGLSYPPQQIVVSNGAKHSLFNAMSALLQEGDEAIIPAPFWLTYPEQVKLTGAIPVIADTAKDDYKLTAENLEKHITEKTKVLFLNNPCNPTGVVYTKEEIFSLAKCLEQHKEIYIISDEIYNALSYEEPVVSIASYSESIKERTVLINGVSKTYAMTGWRIGYSASSALLAKAMGSMQSHMTSNPNSIAQYATIAALSDKRGEEFLQEMNAVFDERRHLMMDTLEKMGEKIIRPKGAFYVMIDVSKYFGKTYGEKKINSALDIANIMLDEQCVAVIPCESFGADNFIRLSYATGNKQIADGLARMQKVFAKL